MPFRSNGISTRFLKEASTPLSIRAEGGAFLPLKYHIRGPLSRLLVPLDFSKVSEPLLDLTSQISLKYKSEVILFHAIEEGVVDHIMAGYNISELVPKLEEEALKKLKAFEKKLISKGVRTRIYPEVPVADPAAAIVSVAEEVNASEILMASKGWGWKRILPWGSTSRLVIKTSTRPVIYIRATKSRENVKLLYKDPDIFRNILYARKPFHPKELTDYLILLEKKTKGRITVIRVPEGSETNKTVSKELEPLMDEISFAGIDVNRLIIKGNVAEEIIKAAEAIGSTAIYTGRSVSQSLHELILGSSLGKILGMTKVPVIIFPE